MKDLTFIDKCLLAMVTCVILVYIVGGCAVIQHKGLQRSKSFIVYCYSYWPIRTVIALIGIAFAAIALVAWIVQPLIGGS